MSDKLHVNIGPPPVPKTNVLPVSSANENISPTAGHKIVRKGHHSMHQKRVFGRFQRVKSTITKRHPGLGRKCPECNKQLTNSTVLRKHLLSKNACARYLPKPYHDIQGDFSQCSQSQDYKKRKRNYPEIALTLLCINKIC